MPAGRLLTHADAAAAAVGQAGGQRDPRRLPDRTGFIWDDKGHVVTNYHVLVGRYQGARASMPNPSAPPVAVAKADAPAPAPSAAFAPDAAQIADTAESVARYASETLRHAEHGRVAAPSQCSCRFRR